MHVVRATAAARAAQFATVASSQSLGSPFLTVEIHEPAPKGHRIYYYVGEVSNAWAHYERILDVIIWELAKIDHQTGAGITAQFSGQYPELKAIETLSKHRGIWKNVKKSIDSMDSASREPYEMRNRFVHDPWFLEQKTKTIAQQKAKSKEGKEEPFFGMKPRTRTQVAKTVADIQKLTEQARALRSLIGGLLSS